VVFEEADLTANGIPVEDDSSVFHYFVYQIHSEDRKSVV
jgi:hypothetical protein